MHDEIWGSVPAERPLDPATVDFALAIMSDSARQAPRVLDVGCGDGSVTARLARAGAQVSGVDPSPAALERARSAHPELELAGTADDGGLPFADATFDAVVCLQVLQHVADTQRLMSELRRVLLPRGSLGVAVPWHGTPGNVLTALRSFERHFDPLEPVLRFYTARSLARLLDDFAFDEVEVRAVGGRPWTRESLLGRARRGAI